jgi:hypothetical protein
MRRRFSRAAGADGEGQGLELRRAGEGLADQVGTHVRGGAGSFVLEVPEPAALVDAMVEKLLRDLVAARAGE